MSTLSDLIAKYNPDSLSSRQIAKLASDKGVTVGHSTIANCINGTHAARPDPNTLKALILALNIPSRRIREAVQLPAEVAGEVQLPPEASQLTPRQWEAVREVIFSMVNPEGNARRKGLGLAPPLDDSNAEDVPEQTRRAARKGTPNLPK